MRFVPLSNGGCSLVLLLNGVMNEGGFKKISTSESEREWHQIEVFRDLGRFESVEEPAIRRGRVVFSTKLRVKPDFENREFVI
jgi:hypothetical protein